jgi:UDP-N-acetylglucosamine 2-epimerase (non-hydrolysing)
MYSVAIVFGTRPEVLKFIPLLQEFKCYPLINVVTIFTGQHDELAKEILREFNIIPDHSFSTMEKSQSIASLSSKIFQKLDQLFCQTKLDLVFSQGDTTTALIAAQVAFYNRIEYAHLEAGLRTKNLQSPFPEEFNRRVISLVTRFHFCPTLETKENLKQEGINSHLYVTGNTIIDLIFDAEKKLSKEKTRQKKQILITCHRRENFGRPLENICSAIERLSIMYSDYKFIIPMHPNPQARTVIKNRLNSKENIFLTDPLSYHELIETLVSSKLVLTDSGGLQEEAPALNVPVLVLRTNTERPEGLKSGAAKLVGTSTESIVSETSKLLETKDAYDKMAHAFCPYGDGMAAKKIAAIVFKYLTSQQYVAV